MSIQVDFVKGHCGWDAVTLLPAWQIPAGQELAIALKIIDAPVYGGLEIGFMGPGDAPDEIRLRIVDSTTRTWLPMCGGMTQIIGKALVETFFRDFFRVDVSELAGTFKLITDAGTIPIQIHIGNQQARKVITTMDGYASYFYEQGVEPLTLQDVVVLRVGDFVVMDISDLERVYPDIDFTRRDPGQHLDIVNEILCAFGKYRDHEGVYGMMFDQRPDGPGQFRIYPRFYSDNLTAASLPWEFQCGTGTVAVAAALAHLKQLPFTGNKGSVLFEWGNQQVTPDPYGIRTSKVDITLAENRIIAVSFSHSLVEIVAEGKMTIPTYR